jgi:hypothetical protein
MKKLLTGIYFIYFSFFFFNSAYAQSPSIEWAKCYGGTDVDYSNCVAVTNDGGYIITGISASHDGDVGNNYGSYDYWLVKTDAAGNIQWEKNYGGSDDETAYYVIQTSDHGYLIAGHTFSNDIDISGNHGLSDFWILKTDTVGNLIWKKSIGGSAFDYAQTIQQTNDGDYIIAGSSASNGSNVTGNNGGYDYWLVKINSSGDVQWEMCYGGSVSEFGYAGAQQTTDGGYVIAGETSSNDSDVTGYHDTGDYWIVKTDSLSNIQWQKCYGGSEEDLPYSMKQTRDGGFIIAGITYSHDGDVTGNYDMSGSTADCWIVKTDGAGTIQWQKSYGGSDEDEALSINEINSGGYIIAGFTMSNDGDVSGNHGNADFWVIRIDSAGNLLWQKCLGGSSVELATSIQKATDGGYIVCGATQSNNGDVIGNPGVNGDIWAVKLSPDPIGISELNSQISDLTAQLNGNYLRLSFSSPDAKSCHLILSDITGRNLFNNKISSNPGLNKIQLQTGELANGIYIATLTGKSRSVSIKVIKD